MDSVPATCSVRRTVRVAVALVVGQALLCGLLGYLTLGRSAGDDRTAEPPRVPAPTATSDYASPSASATAATAATVATSRAWRRATDAATTHTTSTTGPAPATPATAAAPDPPADPLLESPTPTPTPSAAVPISPAPRKGLLPPGAAAQESVVIDDPCAPEGVFGRTEDGTSVRCLRTLAHRLRWKIG